MLEWLHFNAVKRLGIAQLGALSSARRMAICAAAALILSPAAAFGQDSGLRVVPLPREDQVLVSFTLADGYTEEVRAAIRSGLKTTFTYTVDLRLDVPWWGDRSIATSTVVSSVVYDNLEKRFTVIRSIDGRDGETLKTEDEALVRERLTNMIRLPLFKSTYLQSNREYYVRVAATARPSNGSLLWPFGSGTSAQAKFTIIR